MTDDTNPATRRGYLSTVGLATATALGASGLASATPDDDAVTCSGVNVECGGGGTSYPFTMSEVDDPMKTYNGMDYKAAVGLEGRYYGSYTNPNWEDSGWLHDFVIAGFSTARSRDQYASDWNRDEAIDTQRAVIRNNKPDTGAIVSTVGTQTEWVGESRRSDGTDGDDEYLDAMQVAVETIAGEISSKVGWALAAEDFVQALSNDKGSDPGEADEWTPSWHYGGLLSSFATDCSNTIRFAITSPEVGDYIDVTTKQEANIPTVNDSNQIPYGRLDWYLETTDDDGGLSSSSKSVVDSHPSTTVEKGALPPYAEVQEMREHGPVERVMLPVRVEGSTSDI